MLRGVIFDLDRTLLDRDASILSFASSQFERFQSRLIGVDRDSYIETFIRLDARGSVWKDTVYQQLISELRIRAISWDELFSDFDARISDYYVPFDCLHDTLKKLAEEYRLGLITNGKTHFQNRTIEALKITPFFSVILISEAEGVRKPDAEIFHRALRRLGLQPHEAVYVGDHPVTDIQAARDVGMMTFWKRNADFTEAVCDEAFDQLSELPEMLRNFQSNNSHGGGNSATLCVSSNSLDQPHVL